LDADWERRSEQNLEAEKEDLLASLTVTLKANEMAPQKDTQKGTNLVVRTANHLAKSSQ